MRRVTVFASDINTHIDLRSPAEQPRTDARRGDDTYQRRLERGRRVAPCVRHALAAVGQASSVRRRACPMAVTFRASRCEISTRDLREIACEICARFTRDRARSARDLREIAISAASRRHLAHRTRRPCPAYVWGAAGRRPLCTRAAPRRTRSRRMNRSRGRPASRVLLRLLLMSS